MKMEREGYIGDVYLERSIESRNHLTSLSRILSGKFEDVRRAGGTSVK